VIICFAIDGLANLNVFRRIGVAERFLQTGYKLPASGDVSVSNSE
jgi:hypothetical protein